MYLILLISIERMLCLIIALQLDKILKNFMYRNVSVIIVKIKINKFIFFSLFLFYNVHVCVVTNKLFI